MLLSQELTLTSTAQHCRQSCDLCSHTLSLLPSFQGWECWGHMWVQHQGEQGRGRASRMSLPFTSQRDPQSRVYRIPVAAFGNSYVFFYS